MDVMGCAVSDFNQQVHTRKTKVCFPELKSQLPERSISLPNREYLSEVDLYNIYDPGNRGIFIFLNNDKTNQLSFTKLWDFISFWTKLSNFT